MAEQEVRLQRVVVASHARSVAPACVLLYLAVVAGLFFVILHRTGGVFMYTLDDPYIHLALAQNIAQGHYGINPGEAASPSSSIVWPFLLAPFARMAWAEYLPLALNVLFCGMAAWLIGRIVDGWKRIGDGGGAAAWVERFVFAAALMLMANLAGLTFVGMEHGLQLLVAVVCAAGVLEAFAGRPVPDWCLAAAVFGPMVRYEDFGLTLAVAVALVGQGRRGTAVRMALASVVGPVLFSVFLLSRGLPALPSSVLVKANAYSIGTGGERAALYWMYLSKGAGTLRELAWWALLTMGLALWALAAREVVRRRQFVLYGAMALAALQLAVGRFNWFHRYEVYAVAFVALVTVTALVETTRSWRPGILVALLGLGVPYLQAVSQTAEAASNVYQQQYQMHRFVAEFYPRPVAVNDLGLVSYRRPAAVYVLDLWGLASPEASRQALKDARWLEDITSAHKVGLAMIYPAWYPEGAPDEWDALATMCITGPRISAGHRCVVFYRTEVGDKAFLEKQIAAFAKTLPAGVAITLGSDSTDQDE